MELKEGENYLFFAKAFAQSHFMYGLMPIQGSAVLIKDFIFFVPDDRKDFGNQFVKSLTFGAVAEGADTPTMLANLLKAPGMTVENLQQSMVQFLQQNNKHQYIIHLPDWKKMANKTGMFGQTRLQKDENKSNWLVLQFKGVKGAKKMVQDFYGALIEH